MALIFPRSSGEEGGEGMNCSGDFLAHTEQECELVKTAMSSGRDAAGRPACPLVCVPSAKV